MTGGVLKVGILGCGNAARTHLSAMNYLPLVKASALADIDSFKAAALAAEFGVDTVYPNLDAMLEDSRLDAIVVCVPPSGHLEAALKTLRAERHLFLEKPITLTLDEADQLLHQAALHDVAVQVGFYLHHHPVYRRAREFLCQTPLGEVRSIRLLSSNKASLSGLRAPWRREPGQGGDLYLDKAVHEFDLIRFLTSCEARTVSVVHRGEASLITLELDNGALGSIALDRDSVPRNQVEIFGSEGSLWLDAFRFDGFQHFHSKQLSTPQSDLKRILLRLPALFRSLGRGGTLAQAYQNQWLHFRDCVERRVAPEPGLKDGYQALRWALAAREAAEQRTTIEL